MATHENMSVREQKSNDNYTNYSAYEELYNNYKSKVEEFNDKILKIFIILVASTIVFIYSITKFLEHFIIFLY